MEMGLFQNQKLKLTMTPHLQQAISILQYSTVELFEYIQHLTLENPLIELDESFHSNLEALTKKTTKREPTTDFIRDHEPSLQERLVRQLAFLPIQEQERKTAEYIIYMLDEDGYFKDSINDTAVHLNQTVEEIETALSYVQQLEPKGIGATSLQECLLIQLEARENNEIARQIVEHHLEALATKNFKGIADVLLCSIEEVTLAYQLIQTLHPRPGLLISKHHVPTYVIPDFIVKCQNNKISLTFNDQTLPEINLNHDYANLLQRSQADRHTQTYLQHKYKQYVWLTKSIYNRKNTLHHVMSTIVDKQMDFFLKGPNHMEALTLQDVAKICEVHESTVSRATRNKYVQTPYGLFELKHFFTSGVRSDSGSITSSHKIKTLIRQYIESENKRKPFSDQQLANLLKGKHINIARRTVAKYREEMNIPSSSIRKKFQVF